MFKSAQFKYYWHWECPRSERAERSTTFGLVFYPIYCFILYIQWKIIINICAKLFSFSHFFFFVLYISKYMSAISFFFLLINRIIFRKDVIETGYKTEKDIKRRREEKGIAPEEKKITVENFKWRGLIAFYIYIYRWWVKMDIVQRERERCLVMVAAAAVVFFS